MCAPLFIALTTLIMGWVSIISINCTIMHERPTLQEMINTTFCQNTLIISILIIYYFDCRKDDINEFLIVTKMTTDLIGYGLAKKMT